MPGLGPRTHRGRRLAWRADLPDPRDWSYRATLGSAMPPEAEPSLLERIFPCVFGAKKPVPPAPVMPTEFDLFTPKTAALWPPVYDQGQLGSCVANAVCAATAYDLALEGLAADSRLLSRLFLYFDARGGVPEDTGTTIRDAVKSLAKDGDCLEATWPYDVDRFTVKPSPAAYSEATTRHAISYARLSTIDEIKHCIWSGRPVVFGMQLFDDFWDVTASKNTLRIPDKSEAPEGGHAQQVHGFSDRLAAFRGLNSWGEEWGDKGRYWLPYAYVKKYASDFWTIKTVPAVA